MNRPSRTEDDLDHPTWNQNPPFLAPDLTTRQDLNGIANARVQRSRCGSVSSSLGLLDDKHFSDVNVDSDTEAGPHPGVKLAVDGIGMPFIAPTAAPGGAGQARLRPAARKTPLAGWLLWVASVVVGSTVLSFARDRLIPGLLSPAAAAGTGSPGAAVAVETNSTASPLHLLSRRQDACAADGPNAAEYNTPLHVGALLIILGVSSLACGFPLLAARFPVLRIPQWFFFGVRHFGTGVLLATAFVHLLPTAFISLGDPCLSSFWNKDYPAMPGAIALFGIFFVTVIEMVFSPARHFTPSPAGRSSRGSRRRSLDAKGEKTPIARRVVTGGHCGHPDVAASVTRPSGNDVVERGRRGSIEPAPLREEPNRSRSSSEDTLEQGTETHILTPEQQHKKSILQCMLLEVGILFHSVFIGMALSIAIGGDFVVLLIAIAFHQTFEGLALGARIASISWPEKTYQPWLMVLAYGCTTPIGQAIGLATHTLYSPNSEFGLILVGTMNAISSGLLVFASMIELLAEDFLSDHSWVVMRGRKRVFACLLVLMGAILMSLVGAWA